MPSPRPGTLTFLFTDIEGSTQLLQRLGDRYEGVLAEVRGILTEAVAEGDGQVVDTEGDGLFAAFPSAVGAVAAAADSMRRFAAVGWPDEMPVRIRAGLHTGEARPVGDGYVGIDVHRAARIAAAGHGGQVLLSDVTRGLAEHRLPDGASLLDLGTHRLKDLEHPEHLFQLVLPGLPSDFPPPRTLEARPHNVPTQLTSFVGRQAEVAEISELLKAARLVTLTGPGGTGKTRLAVEVTERVARRYTDGAFFVGLAPVRDPTLIGSTIAVSMGIKERPDEPLTTTLLRHIASKEALLILDNFEHLLPGAALVSEVLQAAPRVRTLITSRTLLRASGEHEYPVPPLGLPAVDPMPLLADLDGFDAIALFVQRAQTADPRFRVTEAVARDVVQVCMRLDGLPLAIELAAARLRIFSPGALLARLEDSLSVLRGGPRDLPRRQQTLRDTIAWSHDLLSPDERTVFRRLGIFVRGCTVAAAEAVANLGGSGNVDTLEALIGLTEESLLRSDAGVEDEPRFRMLETIREFARSELQAAGELSTVARRHAEFFLRLAEEAEPHLSGPDQLVWLDRIAQDHDNIRAALRWSVEARVPEVAMRIGAALWRFWLRRNHLREGRRWLDQVLALPTGSEQRPHRARALTALGGLAYWQADHEAAEKAYRESLEIYRLLSDPAGIAAAQSNLGYIATIAGDWDGAWELFSAARAAHDELNDEHASAYDGLGLGLVGVLRQDWPVAREVLMEMTAAHRRLRDQWGLANGLTVLGRVLREQGEIEAAAEALQEALAIFRGSDDQLSIATCLGAIAAFRVACGDVQEGLLIGGGGEALEEQVGGRAPVELRPYEDPRQLVAGRLDPASVARTWDEGRRLNLAELVALVDDWIESGSDRPKADAVEEVS